jgi:hypothetical protein
MVSPDVDLADAANAGLLKNSTATALRSEFWSLPADAFVDRPTAAAAFYLSVKALEALAIRGGGPPYMRVGRKALYRKAALLQWGAESGREVQNTAQVAMAIASPQRLARVVKPATTGTGVPA